MKIGFTGLGAMGASMAANLARSGHEVPIVPLGDAAIQKLSTC